MSTPRMSIALDNLLKIAGIIILSLVGFFGKSMNETVKDLSVQLSSVSEKLGNRIQSVELTIAELKVEVKHLTAADDHNAASKRIP